MARECLLKVIDRNVGIDLRQLLHQAKEDDLLQRGHVSLERTQIKAEGVTTPADVSGYMLQHVHLACCSCLGLLCLQHKFCMHTVEAGLPLGPARHLGGVHRACGGAIPSVGGNTVA